MKRQRRRHRRLLKWHGLPEGEEVMGVVITAPIEVDIEEDLGVAIVAMADTGVHTVDIAADTHLGEGGTNG